MKNFFKFVYIGFFILFLTYLVLPNPSFPKPPPDSVQSKEPADLESSFRRAYFTNFTRQQVLDWYKKQFVYGYLLNYPPEDSKTLIRDQTRSTYLQEVVHPFRESIYINGFEPTDPKDAINIDGVHWKQKIIVRFVPSNTFIRILIGSASLILLLFLIKEWYLILNQVLFLFNKKKLEL